VLAILDRALLVFILVELLYTTRIIRQEHGIIIAEPFLLVGLIAVVRRILLVTAQIEEARGTQEFQNLLAELGVMAGLVVVLTSALFFIQRTRVVPNGRPKALKFRPAPFLGGSIPEPEMEALLALR
jgi:uncharacterized membrane protein (DUF373 family)